LEKQYLEKIQGVYKIYTILIVLFCGVVSQAQIKQVVTDTTKAGFSTGKIQIKDPKSILSAYTYDPLTDRYIYTNTIIFFEFFKFIYFY